MTPWPSKRLPGRLKPERKEWLLIIIFLVLALTALVLVAYLETRAEEERALKATSPAKHLEAARLALRNLQAALRNLGYDVTVSQSDKPTEFTIISKDFDDTDHRVRFLSFLRGENTLLTEVCSVGFETLHLRTSDLPFLGFSDTYSLACINST
jgi:hypothetical protein